MTGRELIIFIMENGLENENLFSKNVLSSICMSADEAAMKFNTGVSTINTWIKMGLIPSLTIDGVTYVYKEAEDPRPSVESNGKKKLQRLPIGKKTYKRVKPNYKKEMVYENKNVK